MKIGIIDTGVDTTHKRFAHASISGLTLFKEGNGKVVLDWEDVYHDEATHGTGIVSIILSHVPGADIFVIKLKSEDGRLSEDLLTEAITYLVRDAGVNIINISMGVKTINPGWELQSICKEAAEKNIVIAAAAWYQHNELCYPAGFSTVYSIGQGVVKDKTEFRLLHNCMTDILAKGGFQRVASPGNQFRFSTGTSLATAHFTGIIAKAFAGGAWNSLDTLRQWLEKNSDNTIISLTRHDLELGEKTVSNKQTGEEQVYHHLGVPGKVNKIAIFPFEEKEMNSILEFNEMLSCELSLAIGYPRIIKLNSSLELIKKKNLRYTVQQLTEAEYDLFDTMVVGYFLDKLSDFNSLYGLSILKECLKRNKNFIIWDKSIFEIVQSLKKTVNESYTGDIYFTSFDEEKRDLLYHSVEYTELKVPSICVVGTNSRQGKFTTQLTIKKLLQGEGYAVSHLSTEPQGLILGADMTFPIGHKGTIYIDVRDWHKTLRLLQQLIEKKAKPDVIVTGSQGGILPMHPVRDSAPPEKLCYVKAFYPDALVCTISPYDSVEFIKKTTDVLTSYVDSKVLFYVMTPWQYEFHHGQQSILSFRKISEAEYTQRLAYYNEHLPSPTINIKDQHDHPLILDIIQQHFSKN